MRRLRIIRIGFAVCLLYGFGLFMPKAGAAELTYIDLINRLTDLERLATLPDPGEKCQQWSSYDRASKYD